MPNVNPLQQPPDAAPYPSIPEPTLDPMAMLATLQRCKEALEILMGQRGASGVFSFPEAIQRIQAGEAKIVTEIEERIAGEALVRVFMSSEATRTGYRAVYGWRLKAGNTFAGMYTLVKNDGTAEMGFEANQFKLTDPSYNGGVPVQVFNYQNGVFNFGVPVKISASALPGNMSQVQFDVNGNVINPAVLVPGYSLSPSGMLDGANVIDNSLFDAKINSLNGNKLWDLTVGTAKIEGLAVTTAKIGNAAVTNAKIENLAVDTAKITDLSVNTLKIAGQAVSVTVSAAVVTVAGVAQSVSVPITLKGTGIVLVKGYMSGVVTATTNGGVASPQARLRRSGTNLIFGYMNTVETDTLVKNGPDDYLIQKTYSDKSSVLACLDAPGAGTFTYEFLPASGSGFCGGQTITIEVTELAK